MKIFILEDDQSRIIQFGRFFHGHKDIDWTCITTCDKADKFRPPYDYLFLDHDLGSRNSGDDGTTFCRLIKDKLNKEVRVVVHSYNYSAAMAMAAILEKGIFAPFGGYMFTSIIKGLEGSSK